jgi:serine/threonine protein kinase
MVVGEPPFSSENDA